MAHLSHKLPWSSLATAIPHNATKWGRDDRCFKSLEVKTAFAKAFADAIYEFADTDKRTDEDKEPYDIGRWGEYGVDDELDLFGRDYCMGFVQSIFGSYMILNVLVIDEKRLRPEFFRHGKNDVLVYGARGSIGEYPEWLTNQLHALLEEDSEILKPLNTANTLEAVRTYCAELFKCMYTRADLFTEERLQRYVETFTSLYYYQ